MQATESLSVKNERGEVKTVALEELVLLHCKSQGLGKIKEEWILGLRLLKESAPEALAVPVSSGIAAGLAGSTMEKEHSNSS